MHVLVLKGVLESRSLNVCLTLHLESSDLNVWGRSGHILSAAYYPAGQASLEGSERYGPGRHYTKWPCSNRTPFWTSWLAMFCCRPALLGIDGWMSKSAVTSTTLWYTASQTYWSALSSLNSFIIAIWRPDIAPPFRRHLPVTSPMREPLQGTHSCWKFQERLPDWTNVFHGVRSLLHWFISSCVGGWVVNTHCLSFVTEW